MNPNLKWKAIFILAVILLCIYGLIGLPTFPTSITQMKENFRQRLVETRVRFKRLSNEDLEAYLASGEWRGKAGGYAIQGLAGTFVVKLVGSYTNVVGLPLYETLSLLGGEGYPVHFGWLNAV